MKVQQCSVRNGGSGMSRSSRCRQPSTKSVTRPPTSLSRARWRPTSTMPAQVGSLDLSKPTQAVFNVLVDDYGEVWVNGQMPRRSGYPSPATIQGLNMPNRVVLAETVKPGDKFQIAVFGINGPISVAPSNFIFFRDAKVEFYR